MNYTPLQWQPPQTDPLAEALAALAQRGIHFTRDADPLLRLYRAPGYPELTAGQVMDLARQTGAGK